MIKLSVQINEKDYTITTLPNRRLLDILREDLRLAGAKEGCGQGECGACTIVLNGKPISSCLLTACQIPQNSEIITIESQNKLLESLKQSYIECGASQCGFCIPGMIMSSYALLAKNPKPTDDEIKIALAGNICRCTGYVKIYEAIRKVSNALPGGK